MAEEKTLHDAFVDELRDTYDAEKQISRALPKMVKASISPKLREALEAHLEETEEQIKRLERVFELLEERARGKHCAGMAGIIEEGNDLLGESFEDCARDASIVAAAQRVEHYEMAAYGTLVAWARAMDHAAAADLLEVSLDEEKAADLKLSSLAKSGINEAAAEVAHPDDEDAPGSPAKSAGNGRGMRARSRE
jgi:ferritin-like metal-binding protein YciE